LPDPAVLARFPEAESSVEHEVETHGKHDGRGHGWFGRQADAQDGGEQRQVHHGAKPAHGQKLHELRPGAKLEGVEAPQVFDVEQLLPHGQLALAELPILEMDGQIAGGMAFFDEPAEDDPGSPFLSHQNTFDSLALRLIRPLVDVKRLDPPDSGHLLRRVVEDDNIKIVEDDAIKFTLIDVNRPVAETALIAAELFEGDMSLADDLAIAIFKKKCA